VGDDDDGGGLGVDRNSRNCMEIKTERFTAIV